MLAESGRVGRNQLPGVPAPAPPVEQPPVTFFSIEDAHPARDFRRRLARLLETLSRAALRKGCADAR